MQVRVPSKSILKQGVSWWEEGRTMIGGWGAGAAESCAVAARTAEFQQARLLRDINAITVNISIIPRAISSISSSIQTHNIFAYQNHHQRCSHLHLRTTLLLLILRTKLQTNAINTMPLVRWRRVPFALEHMSQMAPTVRTHNLRPHHAEGLVLVARHGAGYCIEEGGPSAAGLELLVCGVEGRIAGGAGVDAHGRVVLVELAGEWGFGALFPDDAELF